MKNTPYVKEYKEDGNISNPIIGAYVNQFPNRKSRREKEKPFLGCSKSHHLVVGKNYRVQKFIQAIRCKDGLLKFIKHYKVV